MKVIIPVAGKGTRLYPHTYTRPKPLVRVAGKPILGHILDKLEKRDIEELIFITGAMADQLKEYVETHYRFKTSYIEQSVPKGPAHAVYLARERVEKDLLIIYVDTVFETDLDVLQSTDSDGLIWVKEVEDPRRFGVVVLNGKQIVKLIEKPVDPISTLAQIGMYYFKEGPWLFQAIGEMMERGLMTKGEYFLPEAFEIMLRQGARLEAPLAQGWYDCGTPETLLETNRILLQNGYRKVIKTENSVIISPVYIEDGVTVVGSVIGPYVSIAENARIMNAIVRDSIISEHAVVEDVLLNRSLIGKHAVVKGSFKALNVGDSSQIWDE